MAVVWCASAGMPAWNTRTNTQFAESRFDMSPIKNHGDDDSSSVPLRRMSDRHPADPAPSAAPSAIPRGPSARARAFPEQQVSKSTETCHCPTSRGRAVRFF
jgi:hypothetical protein